MRLFRTFGPGVTMRLNGPRLYLRPPGERDWRDYVEVRAASRSFLEPWEPTWLDDALTRDTFNRRLRRYSMDWRDDVGYSFFLFDNADDRLMGGIGLSNIRRGVAQSATLGYWIGAPYARRGYMSEAAALVLDYGFGDLQLHRIEAACLPHNEASRRLLLRTGFVEEGRARGYLKINGAWHDHVLFGMVAEDWRP
jgi:ribosomal-protein-alanine N-acetyltransferase